MGQNLDLPQVLPQMMEMNNLYAINMVSYDDISGEEVEGYDVVYVSVQVIPGQKIKAKTIRFASTQRELRFSQLAGSRFYGPITLGKERETLELEVEAEKRSDALGSLLARQANATKNNG